MQKRNLENVILKRAKIEKESHEKKQKSEESKSENDASMEGDEIRE